MEVKLQKFATELENIAHDEAKVQKFLKELENITNDKVKLQEFIKEAEKIANDEGIEISDEIRFEQRLIAYLTEFMDKHGYKINFYSGDAKTAIVGVDLNDFYFDLNKTGFFKKFGIRGYTLFEKILCKPRFCILPTQKRHEGTGIVRR